MKIVRASEERVAKRPADAEAVLKALKNPRAAAKAFLKWDAEKSLVNYLKLVWPIIEPGQPLMVGWTLECICEHLEAISHGQLRNVLFNVPPGFSKSTTVGVAWPSYEWGPLDRADLRMISWSYAGHLTLRDNEKCLSLIESPLYQSLWGNRFTFDPRQKTKDYYKTSRKGFRIATSIDGVGTGERADRLTFDDPHSVLGADSEADLQRTINFFGGAFHSRVRNSDDRVKIVDGMRAEPSTIAIIMQRVHAKDVSGAIIANDLDYEHVLIEMEYKGTGHPRRKLYNWRPSAIGYVDPRGAKVAAIETVLDALRVEVAEDERDGWWHLRNLFCEIALDVAKLADPVRFPRHVIERDKKVMALKQGTDAVSSQYDQWPHDAAGALFKRTWFTPDRFVSLASLDPSMNDVRGWDFASSTRRSADRTATVLMRMTHDRKLYVMHARAERLSPGGVESLIAQYVASDAEMGWDVRPSIPIDPAQAGQSQVHNFTKGVLQGVAFDATGETKDKKKRAAPLSAQAEFGNLYIVKGPWNEEFLDELCSFPLGDHDDLVDAASRAYDALIRILEEGDSYTPRLYSAPG